MTVQQLLAVIDAFDWDSWNEALKGDYADLAGNIVRTQGLRAAAEAGLDQFHFDDPFVQRHFTGHVGDLITSVDATTRDAVKEIIRSAVESDEGLTATELGDRILDRVRETFEGYADWRADTIARTETSDLYNLGNLGGYHQAGITKVLVSDGDNDEECAAADGQVWELEYALANRLAHPNCERDFSPIVED